MGALFDYKKMLAFDNKGKLQRNRSKETMMQLLKVGYKNREVLLPFYELFTGPAQQLLDRWFESEILKTTLATDAVIGALISPKQAGSAYVLLHHVMGDSDGKPGVWAYIEGGMGKISECIAASAREAGAEIHTNANVKKILYEGKRAVGVEMEDGSQIYAHTIISNTTPYHTFLELLPGLSRNSGNLSEESPLPPEFVKHLRFADYGCGAFKINLAVNALPNFLCAPNQHPLTPGPQHKGTVHFETTMEEIENAYREASMGKPASRPVIEMTIPSAIDTTIAPPGQHVVQLFIQYAPYEIDPKVGNWADEGFKMSFVQRVFDVIEEHCPGFQSSIVGMDCISPLDLERIFGLHKGNIFHGPLALHQLMYTRPMHGYASHRSPLKGLYMSSAGCHPGGGVMGAAGRNAALAVMNDLGISTNIL